MTQHIKHITTGKQTGARTESEKHRDLITQVCVDCFNHSQTRADFTRSLSLIRQLLLRPSKTPALDEAYLDGIIIALSHFKEEIP